MIYSMLRQPYRPVYQYCSCGLQVFTWSADGSHGLPMITNIWPWLASWEPPLRGDRVVCIGLVSCDGELTAVRVCTRVDTFSGVVMDFHGRL